MRKDIVSNIQRIIELRKITWLKINEGAELDTQNLNLEYLGDPKS